MGLGLLAAIALAESNAYGQAVPVPGGPDAAAAQDAEAQIAELRAQLERLKERAAEWKSQADEYEQAQAGAAARLQEIEREIAALGREEPLRLSAVSSEELDVRVLSAEQDLALVQRESADLAAELDRRSERRRELPELLADAKSRLSVLEQTPAVPNGEDGALSRVQEDVATQRKMAVEQEVRSLELELVSYESRGKLLDAGIDSARLHAAQLEKRLEQLRATLVERREREAQRAAEESLASVAEVESLDPEVQDAVRRLAQENADLAQGRTGKDGLLHAIDQVSRKLNRADKRVNDITADYERLSYRVEAAGLSDSVGLLLRKTRSEVPDVGKYRRFIRMRQKQIAEVQARQLEIREELAALGKVDEVVEAAVGRYQDSLPQKDRDQLASVLRDLLKTKRKHLNALLDDYEVYFEKLVDFDARQQELIEKTQQLLLFIDQRILWVPSGGAVHSGILGDGLDGLRWFASPRFWGQLVRATGSILRESFFMSAAVLLGLLAAFPLLIRRIRPRLAALAEEAKRPSCVNVRPTFECLALSLLLVPWGPGVLAYLGWRLGISPDATQFVRCFANGLIGAGSMWFGLEILRQLLRRDGLAEAHFTWPEGAVRGFRRGVGWLVITAVPLVFTIQVFEVRGEDAWRESLGRIALVVLLLALSFVSHRVLRRNGSLRALLRATPWIRGDQAIWRFVHVMSVTIPLALAVAAARGYYWTSLQLGASYHLTLLFSLLALFAFQLGLRWSLVARRRIAILHAREKRAALAAEQAQDEVSSERAAIPEPELDLHQVDEQTGRLLATSVGVLMIIGLWFLWVDLVPVFGALDTVELWTTTETVTVESVAADGTREFDSENRTVPVTVASVLLAAIVAFMTLVLARNLPGLLELSLFRRLGTAAGERYAYATIGKYAVTLVGGVFAFKTLGVGWGNIQWLVAAVGLGLGFGLQEIFANFVAGIIILFERPIRVGDTVTVGSISGTVTKIHIRATWITSFDRKELVVPNKEFVTTQLINWSLTDPILRLDVPVGIAYGSDTDEAMRILYEIARNTEHVLVEPRPDVLFVGFGDSALNFELRVFSPDVDHRFPILHAIHLEIDRAFRAAGIEIAFPQTDIHIRSTPESQLQRELGSKQ